MTRIQIDSGNQIYYVHHRPSHGQATFVFLNSMGASTATWEKAVAPALRAKGYGTLCFDYRGQGDSVYGTEARLDSDEIIGDVIRVCTECKPEKPILVGLSVGGLFAMRALLGGVSAEGLVLINTLRKPGAHLEWINTLQAKLVATGGLQIIRDVFRPVLSDPSKLGQSRAEHLLAEDYTPYPAEHPFRRLMENVVGADWEVPLEQLTLPTLVLTGQHDRLFRIQEDVDDLVARLPNATVVNFPDSGHNIQADQPDRLVDSLDEFASQVSDAGPLP